MKKITTKMIIVSAMLIALDVIFSRILALNVLTVKVGLGFAAVAVSAMLYGPAWGALCAALGDLVGAIAFPTGAYFPGFTVTAAVAGFVFGLFLYKSRPGFKECFLAALTNGLVVTLILNTLMIHFVFGPPLWPLFYTRLAEFGVMLVIQTLVMLALSRSDALYGKLMELRG
ncbi:MAG: folate family ECF transporter S component [Oscillospiraceae bacterium]|nr:folate family ECF transporter S component [Oscillospiraceae bacterium]